MVSCVEIWIGFLEEGCFQFGMKELRRDWISVVPLECYAYKNVCWYAVSAYLTRGLLRYYNRPTIVRRKHTILPTADQTQRVTRHF